jgi:hypothetical protein
MVCSGILCPPLSLPVMIKTKTLTELEIQKKLEGIESAPESKNFPARMTITANEVRSFLGLGAKQELLTDTESIEKYDQFQKLMQLKPVKRHGST